MKLTHIFRHPVKGLSPESLDQVVLEKDLGMPFDRRFAITHGRSSFDFDNPQWIERRNFVVVAHSPKLTALVSYYNQDENSLSLYQADKLLIKIDLNAQTQQDGFDKILNEFIGEYQPGPYQIVQVPDKNLTDSPMQAVSIMNLSSLRELEQAAGVALDMRRFRGNLWLEGYQAWEEFNWLGKEFKIGNAQFKVMDRIQRCAAINANPDTGHRDINLLDILRTKFGHRDFGILAKVTHSGKIGIDNAIELT